MMEKMKKRGRDGERKITEKREIVTERDEKNGLEMEIFEWKKIELEREREKKREK